MLLIMSCQTKESHTVDSYDALPHDEAGSVIRKAIEYAGGWDSWTKKENFSFYKKITHLDSTGTVEKRIKQHHTYSLQDMFKARMEWTIGDDEYLIINDGEKAIKYKNGQELTDDKSKKEAWNSSYGSHYVIGMPYKLTDPGVSLSYEGIDTVIIDKPVHVVNVEYAKGAGTSGGLHRWVYYFDEETYDLAGNFLDYGDGHSLTTYEVFEDVEGHRFHNKRYSYISNEKKERVVLRTIYENEEMNFDQAIEKNAFTHK